MEENTNPTEAAENAFVEPIEENTAIDPSNIENSIAEEPEPEQESEPDNQQDNIHAIEPNTTESEGVVDMELTQEGFANEDEFVEVADPVEEEVKQEENHTNDIILNFHENIVKDNEYQARFKGAEWFENARSKTITCIGLGGIGAWAAMLVSRFNPRSMYLYDLDFVEGVNISGQFYKVTQINQEKSFCTRDNIAEFSDYKNAFAYTADATLIDFNKSDVFVLGLDSMRARRGVMDKIYYINKDSLTDSWVIEGRLSMRTLQVFCFKIGSKDHDLYQRKFMFSDEEADATVCSMKQTSFMANMIGSVMSNVYMSICLQEVSKFPYGVPFMIEYDCLTYQFKTYLNGEAALIGTGRG